MHHICPIAAIAASVVALAVSLGFAKAGSPPPASQPASDKTSSVLNFTMKDIDGRDCDLSQHSGKVVMIVNTASECGLTPQYKELQALHEKHKDAGLVILGFPSNDFGQQEPGSNGDIKAFCTKNYGVTFPMFAKVAVKGGDQCDLYKHLTSSETNPKFAGEIKWNFTKFLVGRDGRIINRFEPKTLPSAPEVEQAINQALAEPVVR